MRRREFVILFGSTAVGWPLAASAQPSTTPLIGTLFNTSRNTLTEPFTAFRRGLAEAGYVEGQNVAIEYRFADGQSDRLPALAADLVNRKVSVVGPEPTWRGVRCLVAVGGKADISRTWSKGRV